MRGQGFRGRKQPGELYNDKGYNFDRFWLEGPACLVERRPQPPGAQKGDSGGLAIGCGGVAADAHFCLDTP